jgi:hypothetical protein
MMHNLMDPAYYQGNAVINQGDPVASTQMVGGATDGVAPASGYAVRGHHLTNPAAALFILLIILFMLRFVKDHLHKDKDSKGNFKELDITLWNITLVTLLAVPGIVMAKFFTGRFLGPQNPLRIMVNAA